LGGGPTRTITPKGHSDLIDLSWANDSQSMFVSTLEPGGANLLHVDLNGDTSPSGSSLRRQTPGCFRRLTDVISRSWARVQRQMCGRSTTSESAAALGRGYSTPALPSSWPN